MIMILFSIRIKWACLGITQVLIVLNNPCKPRAGTESQKPTFPNPFICSHTRAPIRKARTSEMSDSPVWTSVLSCAAALRQIIPISQHLFGHKEDVVAESPSASTRIAMSAN